MLQLAGTPCSLYIYIERERGREGGRGGGGESAAAAAYLEGGRGRGGEGGSSCILVCTDYRTKNVAALSPPTRPHVIYSATFMYMHMHVCMVVVLR